VVVEISYNGIARGERTERPIEPLGLVRFGDVWHLVAYCRLRRDLRVFRADRIAEVRPTTEHYEDRAGLGFDDFVRSREEARSSQNGHQGHQSGPAGDAFSNERARS
jgi:predicted DNA-binding transcriptional regulator YafY